MAVGIFQFGIDKSVAELSQQAGGERLLFPVFCLDDFRVVQQAERILPDNEADRVGFDIQVVEGNIILLQDVVDRIILTGCDFQVHIREERTERWNVDHRIAF